MTETPSGNPLEPTVDPTRPTEAETIIAPEALGYVLYERVGIGGMGEVYRCGDDALGRDLAIKVIKAELQGNTDAEERFLREARLTGSLQHPGIVPIHQLGRLADGRPYYTMKLIRGRTFADMLRDEPEGPERLPRLLAVIEKVCQAVAYAHSKGVIHRDLKPANVMVGEFGEVQVMDWGLAKELHAGAETIGAGGGAKPVEEGETGEWLDPSTGLSRAGAALGTLAYMPPEQAAGDWDIVDERADVFALGAILCQVLTGRPPYYGGLREDVLRRVRRGDLAYAMNRLERCGAEAALLHLCRDWLSVEREKRPRHAGVAAQRLAAYQAEVQARLRRAEVERAEAQVQAREERKRRRLTAIVAALGLLVVLGIGGGVWWRQQQRQKTDLAVSNALTQAELLAGQARADPLQTDKYRQALEAARVAAQLAESASANVRGKVKELIVHLEQDDAAARNDRELLAALLDVHSPREGPKFQSDAQGTMMALAEPTADEQFAAAFRRWGLDVGNTSAAEAAARLQARPAAVVTEVIAALDEWASERRRKGMAWQPLADLATLLDKAPGSKQRELRAILARGWLPRERAVDALSARLRPVPIPPGVPLGQDRQRLRQLTEQTDAVHEPILGLLTLVRALGIAGEKARAERLLRAAIVARPREVVLHHTLGQLFTTQTPPRWGDAVECYAAARVLRPNLGVNLAAALQRSGREDEGLALLARLVQDSPNNPYLHFHLAYFLHEKRRLDEAMAEYRQAIAFNPKYAAFHSNLGAALANKGRWDEAIAELRLAIGLAPKDDKAHYNLGNALRDKGRVDEAIAEFRQAIGLDPKYTAAHINLGNVLRAKGRLDEAVAAYRQALALNPKLARAHHNLGLALHGKGQLDEAMAEYRQAITLDSKDTLAHNNLGLALHGKGRLGEAMAEYREAIALDPKDATAHYNLGAALRAKGRLDGAIDEYRQAIALDPKDAMAHTNLGAALRDKGRLDEAIAAYRQAIRLKPDHAGAHCNLGQVLRQQGRFAESLASYRRGHELGTKQPGWRSPSAQWVRDAERQLALNTQLPAILRGEASPANAGDAVILASMCQQPDKKLHAASARLYADAFAAEPKLATVLNQQHRYNAACSAALAAAGRGNDAHLLPDMVAAMFRHWALRWLRDDLSAYAQLAERKIPQVNTAIQQRLTHWQRDADLAAVRDPQALARLPAHERAAWHALWHNVDGLAMRLAK